MRSYTEQPGNCGLYQVYTSQEKTQQSSQKVNLHCHYLFPKHPNVYMRMNNSYLIFTFQKEPISVQIRLRFHSQGGMKCKKLGSLKEAFNIYPPHHSPNNPPKKHSLKTKNVNSMHHIMRCYQMTWKPCLFSKRPKSHVLMWLIERY